MARLTEADILRMLLDWDDFVIGVEPESDNECQQPKWHK